VNLSRTEQWQKRLSPKTRAAGMLACTLPSCTDKCASTKVAKIAQIESRTQACLSMTEMQAMTRSVNTGCIDAFGIRFCASIMIANEFAT